MRQTIVPDTAVTAANTSGALTAIAWTNPAPLEKPWA